MELNVMRMEKGEYPLAALKGAIALPPILLEVLYIGNQLGQQQEHS